MRINRRDLRAASHQLKLSTNSLHMRLETDNWDATVKQSGLFFFAHALAEMLYHHSHDSLKVNTLNFKFLWHDLLQVVEDVENGILEKGNLEPYIDEIGLFFTNDIIAKCLYGEEISTLFRIKDANGIYIDKYKDICSNRTSETTIAILKRVGLFLASDMSGSDKYYIFLIEFIRGLCNCRLDYEKERDLYLLTQSFLSELINNEYSQEYIFRVVMQTFFSEEVVEVPNESIDKFLSNFSFKQKSYVVYFPLTPRAKNLICSNSSIDVSENIFELFGGSFSYIGKIRTKAYDPEQARSIASDIIELVFSFVQFEKHQEHAFFVSDAEVLDVETNECLILHRPTPPILRANGHIDNVCFIREKCPHRINNLFNAIELHSSALRSNNINNQLLNLWTAIEVLIPVERHGSFGKINQICNSLSTFLGIRYFRSLLIQFEFDIRSVCSTKFEEITSHINSPSNYQKLAILLALEENEDKLNELRSDLSSHPVLAYRVSYYSSIFSDSKKLLGVYEAHLKKLRCQIMRVYRCRNLIVHDGVGEQNTELIIQNLHFYLDSLIDAIYNYSKYEITDISAICQKASQEEVTMLNLMKAGKINAKTILEIIG